MTERGTSIGDPLLATGQTQAFTFWVFLFFGVFVPGMAQSDFIGSRRHRPGLLTVDVGVMAVTRKLAVIQVSQDFTSNRQISRREGGEHGSKSRM